MTTIPLLFEIAWKSLLIAGATLAVLKLARDRTAGERSWIAHAGLVVLVALPVAALLLPAWSPERATIDATGTLAAPIAIPDRPLDPARSLAASPQLVPPAALASPLQLPSSETVALWLYLVPLVLLVGAMLVAVLRLASLRGRAEIMEDAPWLTALARAQRRMGFKSGTALLVSDELRSPISWGLVRPIILLNPRALAATGEAEAIIAHELAHVARLDWAKLLVSRAACALLWFNPLVWMLAREAHQLREEAADDAVLMSEVDGADYAALLVNAARHDNQGLLIAAHGVAPGKDSLKRRITRVLDGDVARRPSSMTWTAAGFVALAGLAAPLAAFDPFTVCTLPEARAEASGAFSPSAVVELASLTTGAAAAVAPATPVAAAHAPKPLTPEQLIEMRAVGVTDREVRALRRAGIDDISADHATTARALGITPEYVTRMRQAVPGVDFDAIVTAKAMGIDADEAVAMRRAYPGADLEDMAAARATGVTPQYAAEMARLIPGVDLDELAAMRAVGVDAAYVRSLQRVRGTVDADEAIEARATGMPRGLRHRLEETAHSARASALAAARGAVAVVRLGSDGEPDPDYEPPEAPEPPQAPRR